MPNAASSTHRVLTVLSRRSIELPLADVMSKGSIEVFAHVEAKGLLALQFRRGRLTITAGKYIGLIPLTPNISIEVRPKLPVKNLARVLDRARASLKSLEKVDRLYREDNNQGATVLEFLLWNLADALEPVRARGLLKEYVRRSEVVSHPRGRINLAETLQTCWSTGKRHKVKSERFEQTSDTAANRLIKHALEVALTALQHGRGDPAVLSLANLVHSELPDQISRFRGTDYGAVRRLVQTQALSPLRAYYYRALEIALLILSNRGVSLEVTGNDLEFQAFILDFEAVFEKYLRRVLQARLPAPIVVQDGNFEGKKALYDDQPTPSAEPDIVMRAGAARPLIAEVKYRDRHDRSDVNQAVTYGLSYRSGTVVVIHQSNGKGFSGLHHIGTIRDVAVQAYAFDLDADDLDAEEERFAAAMLGLVEAESGAQMAA